MESNLPYLFYSSLFITSVLGILLGILTVSFMKLIKKYFLLQEEYEKLTGQSREKIEKAVEEVIRKVGDFGENIGKNLLDELKSLTKTEEDKYQNSLEEGRKELTKVFIEISSYLRKAAETEAESFKIEAQKALAQIVDEYKKAVEEYKLASFKRVNDSIYKLLSQVSKDVIGKSLNRQDHEDLVIKSLEEAQKRHVL